MLSEGPTPEEAERVSAHFEYLKRLTGEGVVLLAGRTLTTAEDSFGLVIFEVGDEEAARHLMERDPAVVAGVMQARLFPFRVALQAGV